MLNMPRGDTEGITTCAGLLKPVKNGPISKASVSERMIPSAIFAAGTVENCQDIAAAQAKNVDRMMRHPLRQIEILADCQWHRAMKAGTVHRGIIRVSLFHVGCLETAVSWH